MVSLAEKACRFIKLVLQLHLVLTVIFVRDGLLGVEDSTFQLLLRRNSAPTLLHFFLSGE